MVNTNKDMNDEIKGILRLSGSNYEIYAAQRIEELEVHERNLESAIKEITETVKKFNEELAYDCIRIVNKWSQS